jgi:hypothetical protein
MTGALNSGIIDFELVGDANEVTRMLVYLEAILSPPAMGAFLSLNVGPYLHDRARDRFMKEGDDVSGQWSPLATSTVEIRKRQGFGAGPINRRTGELESYIVDNPAAVTVNTQGATLQFPGKTSTKKSLVQKMETAQTGRANPLTKARPVLGMNGNDLAYVITTLAYFVQKGGGVV